MQGRAEGGTQYPATINVSKYLKPKDKDESFLLSLTAALGPFKEVLAGCGRALQDDRREGRW